MDDVQRTSMAVCETNEIFNFPQDEIKMCMKKHISVPLEACHSLHMHMVLERHART